MSENLLLFSLRGNVFAVLEDAVSSVAPAGQLHRLPLSPPCVAGMAIIEGRGATIIDLGACIGDRPLDGGNSGSYLVVGNEERKTGFWVEGTVETIPYPVRVMQLPDLVRSDIVETCALQNSRIVPIINIHLLQQRISRGELGIPQTEKQPSPATESPAGCGQIRVFSLGSGVYCVQGDESSVLPRGADAISQIAYARRKALGIVHYNGEIVPVLPAAERLGYSSTGSTSVLIAVQEGRRYGLLIDRDHGLADIADDQVLPLPPLVRNSLIREAAVQGNRIIPFLNLDAVAEENSSRDLSADIYTPRSVFKDTFRKKSVDLAEFALFGGRYAIPQEEMADVLSLTEIYSLPRSPSIVLGVVVRDAQILPVLDLAAIFGKRSPINPTWSMLRIKNGDFDALVVVEKVFGVKRIDGDVQRQVPIVLPFDVVYGCYLDEEFVRLILNVESLTVHYEKTTIREFMTTVAPQGAGKAEDNKAPVVLKAAIMPESRKDSVVVRDNGQLPIMSGRSIPPVVSQEVSQAAAAARVEVPDAETAPESISGKEDGRESASVASETDQESASRLLERKQRDAESDRTVLGKEEPAVDDEKARVAEEQKPIQEGEGRTAAKETPSYAEDIAAGGQSISEERIAEESAAEESAYDQTDGPPAMHTEREVGGSNFAHQQEKATSAREQAVPSGISAVRGNSVGAVERKQSAGSGQTVPRELRRFMAGSVIASFVIVAALVFNFFADKRGEAPAPGKTEERAVVPDTRNPRNQHDGMTSDAPLVLSIPKSMPLPDPPVYVVAKGDTLWDIAKRFTGNPLNYPRIARDNSIAAPDRIFPGQKIRMKKE